MKPTVFVILLLGMSLPGELSAQLGILPVSAGTSLTVGGQPVSAVSPTTDRPFSKPNPTEIGRLPVLTPELSMTRFQQRSENQSAELTSYSATSVIQVNLPDTSQYGEFEVQRTFTAPRTLLFKPIRFMGDRFVKINIIARLLSSEVDHVERDDVTRTAISPANYKLSFKGTVHIEGHLVHVFQVKPYKNRPGLFKGRIYLEAHTGSLLRVEGRIVKSPSLFVKHIEFVQDYADIGSFTLPVHVHSVARAFFVGRMVIDIRHANYQPKSIEIEANLVRSRE
jgi:hypothetical protein